MYTVVYHRISDTVDATTIKIHRDTKSQLDNFREYKNESYDEVIKKVMFIAKTSETEPELSMETIKSIKKTRARMSKGNFLTEEDTKKRLGL